VEGKAMKPVFMVNDLGSIVYLAKNQMCLKFRDGVTHNIRIDTKKLLERIEAQSNRLWKTRNFLVEPMYYDCDLDLLVIITVLSTKEDEDRATVYRSDLLEVLKGVEQLKPVH
jgi:hypothetical protein